MGCFYYRVFRVFIHSGYKPSVGYAFCKYLLQFHSLPFTLCKVFQRVNIFNLKKSDLSFCFSFVLCFLYPKKYLSSPGSRRFSPVFSCRSFVILTFAFRSMIYFELIVACEVGYGSDSLSLPFLPVSVYLLETPLVENTILSHWVFLALIMRIHLPEVWSVCFTDVVFHQ